MLSINAPSLALVVNRKKKSKKVMIYQEIEDQSFRVIVAYISTYYDGWCSE